MDRLIIFVNVFQLLLKSTHYNKSEFKINMQEVLRSVKQRYRKKIKKTESTKESDAVNDESLDSENETDYESDI